MSSAAQNPWQAYAAGIVYRGYQERALARVFPRLASATSREAEGQAKRQQDGDMCGPGASGGDAQGSTFYLVAPPGSGKTLLGITIAERLGRSALVLSPNAAIQAQWLARLREHWVCVDPVLERFMPHPAHAAEPTDEPAQDGKSGPLALLSLTYQRLVVKDASGELHPNVLRLHRQLREAGVSVLILDECHHLGGAWGQAVQALLEALRPRAVVGLTATPVVHGGGPLSFLLAEPDHEISLPSVIRSGDLAPIQDLCHIVEPAAEEANMVAGCLATFRTQWSRLQQAEAGRDSLFVFCQQLVTLGRLGDQHTGGALPLFRERPELVTSACRFLVAEHIEPPEDLPTLPDFFEPPQLSDQLRVSAFYAGHHLAGRPAFKPLFRALQDTLEAFGYGVSLGRVTRVGGGLSKVLGHSRQKLVGMDAILRTEMRHMGEALCALVLTDYEYPPAGSSALSCETVMSRLTSDAELDALDPLMLTGQSFLVDDDLWPRFSHASEAFFRAGGLSVELQAEPFRGYLRVTSEGVDWNSRTRVALATHMLEAGVSRCLTGTRALLGEGWDCRRLNTLIDLTVAASPVSVNQVRGRTLRRDPERPLKVANNWDLLCVSSLGGFADLDRLVEKHGHLYGVTDDGRIERGIGHIHGSFDRLAVADALLDTAPINAAMHARAADRLGARQRWRVGEPFIDRSLQVMSFVPARPRPKGSKASQEVRPQTEMVRWTPKQQRRHRFGQWLSLAGGLGALSGGAAWATAGTGLGVVGPLTAAAASLLTVGAGIMLRGRSRRATRPAAQLVELATVVLEALELATEATAVVVDARDDGTLRCRFEGLEVDAVERVNLALAELIAPVRTSRYLLRERVFSGRDEVAGPVGTGERVFSVPRALATRTGAARLTALWRRHRDPRAEALHRNSSGARELLKTHLHTRPLGGEVSLHRVWC